MDNAVQYHAPDVPFPINKAGPAKMKGKDQAILNKPATILS
jgi:hypothetical protein